MSELILVGAGPGDPELITLKAIKAIETADVVLYDALANEPLLDYCKPGCIKVYVGKKAGIHAYQQILINDMIVAYGRQYQRVVRLKGGDPFVFGRGHEELSHARAHGMDVTVVPGVSSSLAVAAVNEIPLTKRGVNESFWVVTGTTMAHELSKDVALAAQSTATVVVLMGMKRLKQIVSLFSTSRGYDEPVAVIQNGTLADQKQVLGTLADIEAQVAAASVSSPAIIVIGEVVKLAAEKELIRMVAHAC